MRMLDLMTAFAISATLLAIAAQPLRAEDKKPEAPKKSRVEQIDYGGFFAGSFVCAPDAKYDNNTGIYTADSVAKGIRWLVDRQSTQRHLRGKPRFVPAQAARSQPPQALRVLSISRNPTMAHTLDSSRCNSTPRSNRALGPQHRSAHQ